MTKKSRADRGPSAIHLMEEAIHLLRDTSASEWLIYAIGASLWILGLLFFWAYTTWFAPSDARVAWAALGMVLLFAVLKGSQAEFSVRLLARRLGQPSQNFDFISSVRLACIQLRLQTWGLIVLPVSLVLSFPFGWAFAYFQSASALSSPKEGRDPSGEALREATRWPAQNHLLILLLTVILLTVWLNVCTSFYVIPYLARTLLGMDNFLNVSGWDSRNPTFLVMSFALSWMLVDPLVKAVYVLRVFYGRSQLTGEDIRVDLEWARSIRGAKRALALVVISFCLFAIGAPAKANVTPAPNQAAGHSIPPTELDRAIQSVLGRSEFRWKLRPKIDRASAGSENEGLIVRFVRDGAKIIESVFRKVAGWYNSARRWLRQLWGNSAPSIDSSKTPAGWSLQTIRSLLYALLGLTAVLIAVVIYFLWRGRVRGPTTVVAAQSVFPARPDLTDERTEAAQLPSDGWLALAQEQMGRGEWRLALRALYLASLAQLAAEGRVTLVRSKTNLDYERELRRRAPAEHELQARFSRRRLRFEHIWYGRALADEAEVAAWWDELRADAKP